MTVVWDDIAHGWRDHQALREIEERSRAYMPSRTPNNSRQETLGYEMLGTIFRWMLGLAFAFGLIIAFGPIGLVLMAVFLILPRIFKSLEGGIDSLTGLTKRATEYLNELEYRRERARELRHRERLESTFEPKDE